MLFKQETAYEMRISDWSSDVCSSDLTIIIEYIDRKAPEPGLIPADPDAALKVRLFDRIFDLHVMAPMQEVVGDALRGPENHLPVIVDKAKAALETVYGWLEEQLAGGGGDDRKGVGWGKSGSVGVDIGGR